MRVAEIYQSIQGEGLLTGTESVFVRASGCNLRCNYCDTPHTSWRPVGSDLGVQDIVTQVASYDVEHVVITGGEPMLFAELIPICEQLQEADLHITIETAGTLYLPVQCDLMSISPKMANSAPDPRSDAHWYQRHQRVRYAPKVIRRLADEYACQFKFVMTCPDDLPEVKQFLRRHPEIPRQRVLLMPEGTTTERLESIAEWLAPLCLQQGYVFCPRKHIAWYGLTAGT